MNIELGAMHAPSFAVDPKHLAFVLARYHTVARLLHGAGLVLEVGCGDGTGAPIVRDAVDFLFGVDKLDQLIPHSRFQRYDMLEGPFRPPNPSQYWWDAVYALDVLEHVAPECEDVFLENICKSLWVNGTLIIGTPSLESQAYASQKSIDEHVNCKTEEDLRETLRRHFHCVYMFGMNDTTLHTGYGPMCHYRLAICTGKK